MGSMRRSKSFTGSFEMLLPEQSGAYLGMPRHYYACPFVNQLTRSAPQPCSSLRHLGVHTYVNLSHSTSSCEKALDEAVNDNLRKKGHT